MVDYSRIRITTSEYGWEDASTNSKLVDWFGSNHIDNIYSREIELAVRVPITKVFATLRDIAARSGAVSYTFFDPSHFAIERSRLLMLVSAKGNRRGDPLENSRLINTYHISIWGMIEDVNELADVIRNEFNDSTYARVSWYYMGAHGIDRRSIYIEHTRVIKDEFYPWFKQGVDVFIDQYLASDSSVLMLYGPPGTGKTSFIKYLLTQKQLNAVLTYDEKILNDDSFFVDFLTDDEQDTLIIEDADLLLTSRERDQNTIMSKFLNVSDGLIKINSKKMIFTTNISQLNSVDEALLRKGRCFAAVEFRKLTSQEADTAATAAEQPNQDWHAKKAWSLAEVFNKDVDTVVTETPRAKIGFGG